MDEGTRALVALSAAVALRDPAGLGAAIDAAAVSADPLQAEEALLQSYLFVGFPAALQAISLWRERTGRPARAQAEEEAAAERADRRRRGEQVCSVVYGSAFGPLQKNVAALQPELADWMLEEGYGKVLGRSGLPLRDRELCIIALLAAQPASRQLYSHLRGALNAGASPQDVDDALDAVAPLLTMDRSAAAYAVWQEVRARMRERQCS